MMTHCGTQTIETARLILRQFQPSDAADMLKYWVGDIDVMGLIGERAYTTLQEVEGFLDRNIIGYQNSDFYHWAIIEKKTSICIGMTGCFLVDNRNHFCEMEYVLGKAFHGKGYATEAAREVIDYGFSKVNFHRFTISHRRGNEASKNVLIKCGFVYEGASRDHFFRDGKYFDRLYYSLLKSEWEKAKMTENAPKDQSF